MIMILTNNMDLIVFTMIFYRKTISGVIVLSFSDLRMIRFRVLE